MIHWEILDDPRRALVPQLAFLAQSGFYLAGGTALALQLGHRTSVDFDFYTPAEFVDALVFIAELQRHVPSFMTDHLADGTVIGHIDSIECSFFRYTYPLIAPLCTVDGLQIAAIPDIAAMKMAALAQRGLYRDFIDLYVIAQQHDLRTVIEWTRQKFPQLDVYIMLRALVYFTDAEDDTSQRGKNLLRPIEWSAVKKFFTLHTKQLEKEFL